MRNISQLNTAYLCKQVDISIGYCQPHVTTLGKSHIDPYDDILCNYTNVLHVTLPV